MTPVHVTPSQIAAVSGLTEKHVVRMLFRARGGTQFTRLWFGRQLRIIDDVDGPKVEFASLPDHIREAFVMLDQQELPLFPPHAQDNF
ncbi:MAG: hypothetical protein N4A70_05465 [Pelagimonas sp.]|jgi:hypothetical protein|nr:hypothetical protein [Pelagimonas sp.]